MKRDVFALIPAWSRRAARAVLPDRIVDRMRAALIHVLYGRHLSTVSRQSRPILFVRRLLRRKPVLFHLDVHVADHCNMRCRGCSHFSNVSKPYLTDVAEFAADMRRLSELFIVREIFLLGGEPLLHPQVAEFVRINAECFPRAASYLFTNGLLVTRMPADVWRALAETGCVLYCDDYPVDLPRAEIDVLAASHGVTVTWTEPRDRFFTIPIDLDGAQDADASFAACNGVDNCVNLRHGRLYPCARIAYIDIFREQFGVEGLAATDADSVGIHVDVDAWALMDFLRSPVPWCRYCDHENLYWFPWSRGADAIGQWTCGPGEFTDDPRVLEEPAR